MFLAHSVEHIDLLFRRLGQDAFRAKFKLKNAELDYLKHNGLDLIASHAYDFIVQRLAPAHPKNDGKQTPMGKHPVFVAQHATATCCRGCLAKWHNISKGQGLMPNEIDYILDIIMQWLEKESGPGLRDTGQQMLF